MEKTMTQTDTQVKEKIKQKPKQKPKQKAERKHKKTSMCGKMVIPQRRKYCASPAVWAFFGFLIIFANSVELN